MIVELDEAEVLSLMSVHLDALQNPGDPAWRGSTPEEFYNTILCPPTEGDTCTNSIIALGRSAQDAWKEDRFGLGLLEVIFLYCRWRGIKPCRSPACMSFKASLDAIAPNCNSWIGFRHWAVQLAACLCSDESHGDPIGYVVSELDLFFNTLLDRPQSNLSRPGSNVEKLWLESVDVAEVFEIVEWLSLTEGGVRDPRIVAPPPCFLEQMRERVLEAIDRSGKLGLCPRRLWGIVTNMQRGQLSISSLIPTSRTCVSPNPGHEDCTSEFCQESAMSYTSVKQLHVCVASPGHPTCHLTAEPLPLFPEALLHAAAMAGRPTAWSFDGLSIVETGEPFMAISHVWADGTGNGRGEFNRCLYQRFCDIAAKLGCRGIWWDAICLPSEKTARVAAINNMDNNYRNAKLTLLHDLYVQNYKWVHGDPTCAEGASFAIIMSSWWTRGWTALELANSKTVKVLFADLVVKDLDEDILAKARTPCSLPRQLATTAIRNLRKGVRSLDDLLIALGPRYTSFARDKGIISAILVGVDIQGSLSRQQIYQMVVEKIRIFTTDNIFHGKETMADPAFNWCPKELLDMPVSRTPDASGRLRMTFGRGGEVLGLDGSWDICSLSYLKQNAKFVWKGTSQLLQAKLQRALRRDRDYVLLFDFIKPLPRGLIVKPMIDASKPYNRIGAQFVGSVDFVWTTDKGWDEDATRGGLLGRHLVLIGNTTGMDEVPRGMSAFDYLSSLWPESELRPLCDTSSVEQEKNAMVGTGGIGPRNWWEEM